MNKRAFTLVEMLGVLIILSIISLLIFPAVTHIINQGRDTTRQVQINKLLNATYDFTLKNTSYLPNNGVINFVTLAELKQEGLIDNNFIDPETEELFPNDLIVTIVNTDTDDYDKTFSKKQGKYLYTVKLIDKNTSESEPTISLPVSTVSIQLNGEVPDISTLNYHAYDSDSNDITNRVKYFIQKGNNIVEDIDTSSFAVYKLYFVVLDDHGNSAESVLSIIVADSISPTLSIPSNTTISVGSSELNLLSGATCDDNSGFCEITVSEDIDYSSAGVYTVTYTAQDPSGNTTIRERIITIE